MLPLEIQSSWKCMAEKSGREPVSLPQWKSFPTSLISALEALKSQR